MPIKFGSSQTAITTTAKRCATKAQAGDRTEAEAEAEAEAAPFQRFCILRCSPDDAGEYKAIATSPLGEALTFGTLLVNCEHFSISYQPHPSGNPLHGIQRRGFRNKD